MIEIGTHPLWLAFMGLGSTELIILAVVLLVLFGGAKLPSLMRNMGRSVNEFKTGLKEKPTDRVIEEKKDDRKTSEDEEKEKETPVA